MAKGLASNTLHSRCLSTESVDMRLLWQRFTDGRRSIHKWDERTPVLYPFAF